MSVNYKLVLRECKRRRAPELDFSQQDITILPDELFTLTQLKKLDLSGNHISCLDKRMEALTSLECLDLHNNALIEFPVVLLSLPRLKTLNVSGNMFADQYSFLNKVGDNFDVWKAQVKAIVDRSFKSFTEDFFSDDEPKVHTKLPSFVSKSSESEEKKSQVSKATACQDDRETIALLKQQIEQLKSQNAVLEGKTFTGNATQTGFWNPKNSALPTDFQLKSPNEVTDREKISQGGFSIIEKGKFRGTTVVVKRFFDPTNSAETREEFLNEAQVLNRLRHPHIVTLMAAHLPTSGADNFLVFEFVSGGNLYDALHVKRVKFDKKMFLLKLAETMQFMHMSGVCHRDLKSLNILLDARYLPKIVDFGLARFGDGLNKGFMKFAATPSYSAPELFLQKELTPKVDVYAFGVIMWEVLQEDVPHRSVTPADIRKFVVSGQVLDVKGLSSSAGDIIKSCCAVEPEKRPSFEAIAEMISRAKF